jgi:hypothetical protein
MESPQTPAAPAPVHQTDTAGMSESQAEAAAWVDSHSAEIPGTSNAFLLKQYREATQHAFGNAPAPSWLQQSEAAATALAEAGAKTVNESDMPGLAAEFEPMGEQHVDRLINRAVVTTSLPREMATEAAQFCLDAKLPQVVSEAVLDRLGKHNSHGHGPGTEALTPADVETLSFECARMLGGAEKAAAEVTLARKYLHSVGGDALLATVDQRAGSLGYDPRLILQLSMIARARGLDK